MKLKSVIIDKMKYFHKKMMGKFRNFLRVRLAKRTEMSLQMRTKLIALSTILKWKS